MKSKVGPIKPEEVVGQKKQSIPPEVFEAFNSLIVQGMNGNRAVVRQNDVVMLLEKGGMNRREIFDKGWLDIEGIYREAGWEVSYDKPGYNESYEASFLFEKK